MINDYHALRAAHIFATQPDDMVHDIGQEVETRALARGLSVTDLLYFAESVMRSAPRIRTATVTDGVKPREGLG